MGIVKLELHSIAGDFFVSEMFALTPVYICWRQRQNRYACSRQQIPRERFVQSSLPLKSSIPYFHLPLVFCFNQSVSSRHSSKQNFGLKLTPADKLPSTK